MRHRDKVKRALLALGITPDNEAKVVSKMEQAHDKDSRRWLQKYVTIVMNASHGK